MKHRKKNCGETN